jgi:hypothetical protein
MLRNMIAGKTHPKSVLVIDGVCFSADESINGKKY